MAVGLSPVGNDAPFFSSASVPLSGGKLFIYSAGSSTKVTSYSDSGGSVQNANPVILNSSGYPASAGNLVEIWLTTGSSYKFVLTNSTDTDPPASPLWTRDNVPVINDTSSSQNEWVAGPTPTYVSATQFTLVGDQTGTFQVGRRVKATVTAGTSYGTITASAFAASTTVTVDTTNSNALDSGLTAVSYGILASTSPSVPGVYGNLVDALGSIRVGTAASLEGSISAPNEPINLTLTASVGSNILTVAIKTRSGSDPTASRPVLIPFRSATATTGDYTWRSLTAATSIATTVGGTFGVANSTAFRLWIVAFDDGGTVRLALINCLTTVAGAGVGRDVTGIFNLPGWGIASSTQIGAGSTSAGVFYSFGAAVSSKSYIVLGYLTYESGLATMGTFGSAQTRLQIFSPVVPLPGAVIQTARNQSGAVATGTTTVAYTDTLPQNTAGDQYMTQAITPTSAANVLDIDHLGWYSGSGGGRLIMSMLFQDTTANAMCSMIGNHANADWACGNPLRAKILAATTSSTTFKVRAGCSAAATTTFNGSASGRIHGGVIDSLMEVREIMA